MWYISAYVDQILRHQIIVKKIEYFKTMNLLNEEPQLDSILLQTIRIPKNLLSLTDKLPQPNYEKMNSEDQINSVNRNNRSIEYFPDIANNKKKRRENGVNNEKHSRNEEESKIKEIKPERDISIVSIKKIEKAKVPHSERESSAVHNEHPVLPQSSNNGGNVNNSGNAENPIIKVKKPKREINISNSIDNDLLLLPKIKARKEMNSPQSPVNLIVKNELDIMDKKNNQKKDSRNIAYNEKKILKLLQNASIDGKNHNGNSKIYIPYVLNNRNSALMNKYKKYKVEKSYSPIGKQKLILRGMDPKQIKLPIIQNQKKNNIAQIR